MGVCPCLVELMLFLNKGACKVHELLACSSAHWRMCQLNSGEMHCWLQASYRPDQIAPLPQMLNAHERGNPHGRRYTFFRIYPPPITPPHICSLDVHLRVKTCTLTRTCVVALCPVQFVGSAAEHNKVSTVGQLQREQKGEWWEGERKDAQW